MASRMYSRGLVTPCIAADGTNHQIVNAQNLSAFENETTNNINDLIESNNHLHNRLNAVEDLIKFAGWAEKIYPELMAGMRNEYKTSEQVAKRLEDSNYISEADMKQEMQVTP